MCVSHLSCVKIAKHKGKWYLSLPFLCEQSTRLEQASHRASLQKEKPLRWETNPVLTFDPYSTCHVCLTVVILTVISTHNNYRSLIISGWGCLFWALLLIELFCILTLWLVWITFWLSGWYVRRCYDFNLSQIYVVCRDTKEEAWKQCSVVAVVVWRTLLQELNAKFRRECHFTSNSDHKMHCF